MGDVSCCCVVTVPRIGPYHLARLSAAAKGSDLHVLETVRNDEEYGWDEIRRTDGFARHTLLPNGARARTHKHLIRTAVRETLGRLRPHVVAITGWAMYDALCALQWCVDFGVPAVLMSESQARDDVRRIYKEAAKRHLVAQFRTALVGGVRHRDYLAQLGMASERIYLGYDVVDNVYFHEGAQQSRAGASKNAVPALPSRYILSSCRFIPKKNLDGLIKAFALYRANSPNGCELVLLGDGALRDRICEVAKSLGVDGAVHMPGFVQYDDLPHYYGNAEIFLHVSTVEQWGLVVNEAMASCLPVIVSRACGCAADLVSEGVNGFSVDPLDCNEIAQRLKLLSDDPGLRKSMGARSWDIISEWGPERFGTQLQTAMLHARDLGPVRPGVSDKVVMAMARALS